MFNSPELILSTRPLSGLNIYKQNLNTEYHNRFQENGQSKKVLDNAVANGFTAVMSLSETSLLPQLKQLHKENGIKIYPIIPNMSSYVREACDYGIVGAGIRRLKRLGLANLFRLAWYNWTKAPGILLRDFNTAMSILFDVEMTELRSFAPPAVFLHPQVTDLALANNNSELLKNFAEIIRNRYKAEPALMTFNLGTLMEKLRNWNLDIKVISAPFNSHGFIMKPDKDVCENLIKENSFTFIADRISAASGLTVEDFKYLKKMGVKSAVVDAITEDEMKLAYRSFIGNN